MLPNDHSTLVDFDHSEPFFTAPKTQASQWHRGCVGVGTETIINHFKVQQKTLTSVATDKSMLCVVKLGGFVVTDMHYIFV